MRASAILGLLGLLLLILSFAPWSNGAAFAPAAPVSKAALVAEGRALFLAKGCATCHRHEDVGRQPGLVEVGPALTDYAPDEAFVRRWLRDPRAVRPQTMMPNLALEDAEIEALITFLTAQ